MLTAYKLFVNLVTVRIGLILRWRKRLELNYVYHIFVFIWRHAHTQNKQKDLCVSISEWAETVSAARLNSEAATSWAGLMSGNTISINNTHAAADICSSWGMGSACCYIAYIVSIHKSHTVIWAVSTLCCGECKMAHICSHFAYKICDSTFGCKAGWHSIDITVCVWIPHKLSWGWTAAVWEEIWDEPLLSARDENLFSDAAHSAPVASKTV